MTNIREEELTRYVLGEVSVEERIKIEKAISDDEGLKAEVQKLRVFTANFAAEIKKESQEGLAEENRQVISRFISKRRFKLAGPWVLAPLGAALGFMAIVVSQQVMQKQDANTPVQPNALTNTTGHPIGDTKQVGGTAKGKLSEPIAKNESTNTPVPIEERESLEVADVAADESGAVAIPSTAAPEAARVMGKAAPSSPSNQMMTAKRMRDALESGSIDPAVLGASGLVTQVNPRQSISAKKPGARHQLMIDQQYPAKINGDHAHNTESYDAITENAFKKVGDEPYSTFSIDVDTAGYSNFRRMVRAGQLPAPNSVRIEEMLNYFSYDYKGPTGSDPFAVNMELSKAPWNEKNKLLRVGIKAKDIDWKKRPNSNLVFLLDVSGSMDEANKLPLVKQSLKMLIENMGEKDRVAIVVYAGASGLALPSTNASDRSKIIAALDNLQAGGSTNGGDGIRLAYKIAQENFIKGGINRVMLATDGDFNVGTTSQAELISLIEEKAKSKVFLTVMGFGMGNYKDSTLEKLADKGNGAYAYIDTAAEARKVLVEQAGGTMMTIAKDVKIQLEFNPKKVAGYRLIGYENRLLNKEDFNDDTKDAGEIGAGHTVTALYEIVPVGESVPGSSVDPLRYQKDVKTSSAADTNELLNFKLRYKKPEADVSQLISVPLQDSNRNFAEASADFKFQAAVAEFGMILRDSKFKGSASFNGVLEKLEQTKTRAGKVDSYRAELIGLVRAAQGLKK